MTDYAVVSVQDGAAFVPTRIKLEIETEGSHPQNPALNSRLSKLESNVDQLNDALNKLMAALNRSGNAIETLDDPHI